MTRRWNRRRRAPWRQRVVDELLAMIDVPLAVAIVLTDAAQRGLFVVEKFTNLSQGTAWLDGHETVDVVLRAPSRRLVGEVWGLLQRQPFVWPWTFHGTSVSVSFRKRIMDVLLIENGATVS